MNKNFRLVFGLTASILTVACGNSANTNSANSANTASAANANVAAAPSPSPTAANQNGGENAEMMNHDSHMTMTSAADAVNQPFDLQFLDTMAAHHDSAILMAKAVNSNTQNEDLRRFAVGIINSQTDETRRMREWRQEWFAGKPLALNMQMRGMADSMKDMNMGDLSAKRGRDFDTAFINAMIPHHVGAVEMSKDALERAEHAEIKTLAQGIIQAQEAEIEKMRGWQNEWKQQ